MALRKIHIQKIAEAVAKRLCELKAARAAGGEVVLKVVDIIMENMEAERALDEEAGRLLARHRKTMGAEIDEQRALLMIKRQLAKEKNFVL